MDRDYLNSLFILFKKKIILFGNSKDYDDEAIITLVESIAEENIELEIIKNALKQMSFKERFFSLAALMEYIPNDEIEIDILHEARANLGYRKTKLIKGSKEEKAFNKMWKSFSSQFGQSKTDSYAQQQLIKRMETTYKRYLKDFKTDPTLIETNVTGNIEVKNAIKGLLGG